MLQIFNLADDVVVQLQFHKPVHTLEVIDFDDVQIGERQVLQIPQRLVILVIDLVLLVVLDDVALD